MTWTFSPKLIAPVEVISVLSTCSESGYRSKYLHFFVVGHSPFGSTQNCTLVFGLLKEKNYTVRHCTNFTVQN